MTLHKLVNIYEVSEILKTFKCLDGVSLGQNRSVYTYNIKNSNLRIMINFTNPSRIMINFTDPNIAGCKDLPKPTDKIMDGFLNFLQFQPLQHYSSSTGMKGWMAISAETFWDEMPDAAKEEFAFHLDIFR